MEVSAFDAASYCPASTANQMNLKFADRIADIIGTRIYKPADIAACAAARKRASSLMATGGGLVVIAADHPGRGALGVGGEPFAMADRVDLLARLCIALQRPGVGGVLGTADILEELLLLGVLEGKVVIGSMNRGGLAGTVFEMDDRFTGYDAATIARRGFDGGKTAP
jgi:hypothetical protein